MGCGGSMTRGDWLRVAARLVLAIPWAAAIPLGAAAARAAAIDCARAIP